MTSKRMYFGTKERMTWIPCPSINAGLSASRWGTTTEYLNGGAGSRVSTASHRDYSFSWSPTSQESLYSVLDYFDGTYGDAPYYFIDPFAQATNVLPSWLAAPRIAAKDGPSLLVDERPDSVIAMPNTLGYPTKSAVYNLTYLVTARTFDFPVPPGYTFHFGVKGSGTGDATVTLNGVPVTPGLTISDSRFSASTTAPWARISVSGVGLLHLTALQAVVLPTGETPSTGGFVSGRGNSGVSLKNPSPVITGYSAALEHASVGASVELIETGGWA